MEIIVLIKQVPEIGEAKIDPKTGTLNRKGIPLTINPIDLNAIELALQIKEELGGKVRVITMGPESAEKVLREALALGCDEAFLLTGQEFAASDTYATAFALAQLVIYLKPWDIIITGEKAIDGDTGQVGPAVAAFLNIPILTYAIRCQLIDRFLFLIDRTIESGVQRITLSPPFLITVTKGMNVPRFPTLRGKIAARQQEIQKFGAHSLSIPVDSIGLSGSPTRVVKVENFKIERKGKILKDMDPMLMADQLVQFLIERGAW
ncbi:MAG TPA: electron transfer flavoprotein subunit beta [Candidatus Atribacteria bacterium]|nr:electron transfer flavoprotein subunit beta [Candidatus Atribacteria bacterium]